MCVSVSIHVSVRECVIGCVSEHVSVCLSVHVSV